MKTRIQCGSGRASALISRTMEPTHVGCYRVLKKPLKQTRLHRWRGHSALGFSALTLALPLLLAALPAGADTSFTTTNWVAGVPVPGIQYTNSSGLVYLKGNVHIHRVLSSDARIAGRLTAWMDLAYQADGTALLVGSAYVEPGNWDATGTNFTPSGGVWDAKYNGMVQADGSDQIHFVGYGIGGTIEGLRLECTATKGPGAPFDPAIPYFASGTIKPAPLVITDPIDESQAASWPEMGVAPGGALIGTNQQLTIYTPYPVTWSSPMRAAAVTPGHTLETRVDLVRMNGSGSVVLAIYYAVGIGYWFEKAGDHVSLGKQTGGGWTFFTCERVATGNTNQVLTLALTPSGQNLILTARVLDRDNEAVIYEKSFLDTPGSDPSLTSAQVQTVVGATWLTVVNDPAGPRWTTFRSPWLGLLMHTDGTTGEVTFDHFEMRTYEVPTIGIQRAVQLTWPDMGMNFAVEGAPTLQGPWLPLNNTLLPGMQQITVPVNKSAEFFRLQQVP